MSLAARVQAKGLAKAAKHVKVLTIDVERFPMRAFSYERWQTTIPVEWIIERARISCFSAKWLGEKAFVVDERAGHREMVQQMFDLLSEADIVCTYNGWRADLPWMREEFAFYRMGLPAPFKSVDLYKTNRQQFNLASRSLQYFGEFLGKGGKLDSGGSKLVRKLMEGTATESDWRKYRTYNRRDTELTESIYLEMLPYLKDQPHMGVMIGDGNQRRCAFCGGAKLKPHAKQVHAFVRTYQLFRCESCLGWNRSTILTGQGQFTRPIR